MLHYICQRECPVSALFKWPDGGLNSVLWSRGAVCSSQFLEITIWDFLTNGSTCLISLGPIPANLSSVAFYSCGGNTLYGKRCLGITDKINLFFLRSNTSAPVVVKMGSYLNTLGIADVTQLGNLSILVAGAASPPIQPVVFSSLQFVIGDLFINGQVRPGPHFPKIQRRAP